MVQISTNQFTKLSLIFSYTIIAKLNALFLCLQNEVLSECVSCGERADIYCSECEASRCNLCNDQWHRHPKRREHKLEVILLL